ncbi:MAG: hypothetical protein JW993_16210 [Sedimentisphaerales bacterium]|nr:hypothetical protein [Sedimentisphaerales bacterium]
MTRDKRAVAVSTILGLLLLSLGAVGQAGQDDAGSTVTISGSVGLPGVTMKGLPENPVTDENGAYQVEVQSGWTGNVAPTRAGYRFEPPSRSYRSVRQDLRNEDYSVTLLTYSIAGNVGASGVLMKGLPDCVTGPDGTYRRNMPYGWSGTVTPVKEGFTFTPPAIQYSQVTHDLTGQNYSAEVVTFRISGTVSWPGVVMEGLPNNTITDAEGRYVAAVPYGWTGTVAPKREGCAFEPASRQYAKVTADQDNQNYVVASIRAPGSQGLGAAADILVVPTQQVDVTAFAQTREDMQIMLQILREKISEPRTILGVLYDFGDFFGSGGRQPEALYLQGYGAVFVLEVSFPLSPGATSRSIDANEPKQRVDPVWQRAQRRLYAPRSGPYGGSAVPTQADPASFEQFTDDMIKTLKHAANIRHLGSDESVILTIVGQMQDPASAFGRMSGGPYGSGPYGGGFVTGGGYSAGGGYSSSGGTTFYSDSSSYGRVGGSVGGRRVSGAAPAPTVLTIQAGKADIDAFARGDLDFEQFNAKVKTFSY